jgi:threonine dehydrogenase-like Zn-dependent dehydrogenase
MGMKARSIHYAGKQQVNIVEVDVHDPGPGEVQVEGLACGVCAWDLHVYRNGADWPVWPGHEGVARVAKVGPGVGHLKEGDVVTGVGLGFSELQTRSASGLYVLPKSERPLHNWIVEPVSCVVTGLDHCKLKAGDRVAVVGCGFMGQMFVQALSRSLLDRLIAIDVDPARLQMARQFGATDAYDARELDPQQLRDLWLDTVVDCSGNQAGLDLSSKIVKDGGRLNLFGWNHGTGAFPGDVWHMRGITVVNSAPNSAERDPWPAAIRLLDRGQIDLAPLVSHVVPLEEYPSLLARATTRGSGYMKGVVRLKAA